ncbi:DUF1508 domain-containing protein [Halopenitus persicus]|uniref:DUF1508 domain-containing protein n=1 Tax=Halopenitus persicus TaxID=1048396 RepID=UPI000BBA7042|nr:DUF1508 domain-containing protein [Halopenitus persicus]
MTRVSRHLSIEFIVLLVITAITFLVLFAVLPFDLVQALLIVALVAFFYFGIAVALAKYKHRTPDWLNTAPLWLIIMVPVAIGVSLLFRYWAEATFFNVVFVLGMMFMFLYYWLMVPFAMVQKIEEQNWDEQIDEWPEITVLIPAYKERGHIGRTLDSISATTYTGGIELIVIDDGSADGTYEEATAHAGTDALVIQKENGGKHSALNRGLEEATNDIIVAIDADSWIDPDAFAELVKSFKRHPNAGAIAGNVKVGNRGSFITNLQALEYIVGINTFRRAFDHVGLVSVVPGCLGAFRADTLREVGGYSADTLTEDFDLTIEILKRGRSVHMSEGIVYTYAPTNWRGLYRQRLRWYRGQIQTLRKHVGVFSDPNYGLLHRLVFPYAFLSMTLLPLMGVVVSIVIPLAIIAGQGLMMLKIAMFFFALIFLLSLLAIEIDAEDRKLVVYSPLSVIGYKQFQDAVLIKSIFDVFSGKELGWTSAGRIPQEATEQGTFAPPAPTAGADNEVSTLSTVADSESSFDVYHDAADEWRWRLRHRNGNIIADSSEGYSSRDSVEDAVGRVAATVGDADTLEYDPAGFEVYEKDPDEWHWQLRMKSGRVLARSKLGFDSRGDTLDAIERVRNNATEAERWSITVGETSGYHWRLTAPNGRVIARNAKGYTSKSDAETAMGRVRKAIPKADTLEFDPVGFVAYVDTLGEWRWRLKHRNGRILADSGEGYSSKASMRNGIETVQRTAREAAVAQPIPTNG